MSRFGTSHGFVELVSHEEPGVAPNGSDFGSSNCLRGGLLAVGWALSPTENEGQFG